jgi:hypothetical protein
MNALKPPVAEPAKNDEAVARHRAISRLELAAVIVAAALVAATHVVLYFHGGGLWRDEVNTVNVATRPTFAEFWEYMRWDSFPILWPITVRAWWAIGLGGTDEGLRLLGLVIGLSLIPAAWWAAHSFNRARPFCALTLMALCPAMFLYGDSLRAYGLAALLIVLTFALVWRVVEKPTWRRAALAAAAAVLSVNVTYYNPVLLLAFCAGGAAVALRRRDWRLLGFIAGIGILSAVVVATVNWRHFTSTNDWNDLVKTPVDLLWFAGKFKRTVMTSGQFAPYVWLGLGILAGGVTIGILTLRRKVEPDGRKDLALFMLTVLAVGLVAYAVFLKVLSYVTEPWYYLSVMAMLALAFDASVQLLVESSAAGRILRIAGAAVLVAVAAPQVWAAAHLRHTNVDVIAAHLERSADKDDLVVVNPWSTAITFDRYYHGAAPWVSIPDLSDHLAHRMDLLRDKLLDPGAMGPIERRMAACLGSGRRLWVVGTLRPSRLGGDPPAYTQLSGQSGFLDGPYDWSWQEKMAYWLQKHAGKIDHVQVPVTGAVDKYEDEPMVVYSGWIQFEGSP